MAAALRVIRAPDDPLAIEAFAELLLPGRLLEQVRVALPRPRPARRAPDLRPRRAGRRGLEEGLAVHLPDREPRGARAARTTRCGRWWTSCSPSGSERIAIRSRSARVELSDPRDFPGAGSMAARLHETVARGDIVWVEPDRGVEIPLLRMLKGALGDYVQRLSTREPPGARGLRVPRGKRASARAVQGARSSTTAATWPTRSRTTSPSIWRPPTWTSPSAASSRSRRSGCGGR